MYGKINSALKYIDEHKKVMLGSCKFMCDYGLDWDNN